jgi:hypothetical protein
MPVVLSTNSRADVYRIHDHVLIVVAVGYSKGLATRWTVTYNGPASMRKTDTGFSLNRAEDAAAHNNVVISQRGCIVECLSSRRSCNEGC